MQRVAVSPDTDMHASGELEMMLEFHTKCHTILIGRHQSTVVCDFCSVLPKTKLFNLEGLSVVFG